ncbi:MAG: hypothetical protein AAGA71_16710 [Pseudomonadota bacterium]
MVWFADKAVIADLKAEVFYGHVHLAFMFLLGRRSCDAGMSLGLTCSTTTVCASFQTCQMYAQVARSESRARAGRALRHQFGVLVFILLPVLMLSPDFAFAQSASFRSVDTNSDRVLTFDELAAAFGRDGAIRLLRSTDHNGDGRITIPELRRRPERDDQDSDQKPGSSDDHGEVSDEEPADRDDRDGDEDGSDADQDQSDHGGDESDSGDDEGGDENDPDDDAGGEDESDDDGADDDGDDGEDDD